MGPPWGPSGADRSQVGPMLATWTLLSGYIMVRLYCISMSQWLHACHGAEDTVYPKKYAHGFCFAVLCCGYTLTDFPISIRLTSLALWQSNDCPSASKATLMNMDKYFMWIHYEWLHNHNKAKHNKTVCIFLGIYCTFHKLPHLQLPSHRCGSADIGLSNANVTVVWTREICRHLVLRVPQDIVSAHQSF